MSTEHLTESFLGRYRELLEGMPPGQPTWITTGGPDGGVHGTLADVTAEEASRAVAGSTLAGHAYHLWWAIDMVNRYFEGDEAGPDWSASWAVSEVTPESWDALRANLHAAGEKLFQNATSRHDWSQGFAVNGALASLGHTAYHLGAIRQIKKQLRS